MFKVVHNARIATLLLSICMFIGFSGSIHAQIAPTNTAVISGSLSDANGKAVIGAQITLTGSKHAATQTDAHGEFVFVGMPFGEYQLFAAATGLGTATRSFSVQGDTNVAITYEPLSVNGLKTIANVHTSANARFNVTPASITQVSPLTNAFEGKTSWRTILEQIPGVAQAGLGNGQTALAALPDGPFVPVQISINGALPYETATLLDDMPLIGGSASNAGVFAGSGTDLSLYPLNGFSAADVVRGPGASAPSIVDSIGGSFVLHPPGQVNTNHYTLSLSTDPYGGIVANALAATRWKKLSLVITYGVNDSPGPTNSAVIPAELFRNPLTVNGQAFSPDDPPCNLPGCFVGILFNPNFPLFTTFPLYGFNRGLLVCCTQTSTAWSQHSGSVSLHYEVSPSLSADFVYTGETSEESTPFQNYTTNFFVAPADGYTGSVPVGERLFSFNGSFQAPGPLQNTSSLLEEKITAKIGDGILRLAALQNRDFSTTSVTGPTTLTQQLFGTGILGGVRTTFNGGTYTTTYAPFGCASFQNTNNRDLLFAYTTPLGANLRAGASFVQSYYDIPFGTAGSFGNSHIPSADSETTHEFRVFVGTTPSEKTSIDLSMYFTNADYHVVNPNDPTGNTYVDARYNYAAPRLGFVWRPTAAVAVRASAGGGFAEAPLTDLAGTGHGNANQPTPSCNGVTCSVGLTNINLRPEISFGFDVGTDIRLHRNTVLSLDVYRTNLFGQFYKSTQVTGTYLGLPLFTTQWGNLGLSRYEGVLLDVRHDAPHGTYWSLSGGLTRGYVVSVPSGFYNTPTCTMCNNLTVVPNVNFNGTFTPVSVPYAQALGTLGYRWNADKYIDVVGAYYGNNNTYFRPAFVEVDGHVGYPIAKNTSLLVTFRNITGIYDSATQAFALDNFIGAPTISGGPFPLYGEEYGPRTVIITTNVHF